MSNKVLSGSFAATALSILANAGILPTPNISVSPPLESPNAIAEVDKWEPDVNLTSPSTIPTVTLFSNKFPAV